MKKGHTEWYFWSLPFAQIHKSTALTFDISCSSLVISWGSSTLGSSSAAAAVLFRCIILCCTSGVLSRLVLVTVMMGLLCTANPENLSEAPLKSRRNWLKLEADSAGVRSLVVIWYMGVRRPRLPSWRQKVGKEKNVRKVLLGIVFWMKDKRKQSRQIDYESSVGTKRGLDVWIGHEDSVGLSVCKVHISATWWRFYTLSAVALQKRRKYAACVIFSGGVGPWTGSHLV
jgi:hypothetical protein